MCMRASTHVRPEKVLNSAHGQVPHSESSFLPRLAARTPRRPLLGGIFVRDSACCETLRNQSSMFKCMANNLSEALHLKKIATKAIKLDKNWAQKVERPTLIRHIKIQTVRSGAVRSHLCVHRPLVTSKATLGLDCGQLKVTVSR